SSTTWSSCSGSMPPSPCSMKGGFSPRGAWRKSGWTTGCSTSTWGGPSVLQVTDLRAGYGSTPVLTGVNLQVAEGEVVAVVGLKGVGQATSLRRLTAWLPARGGT